MDDNLSAKVGLAQAPYKFQPVHAGHLVIGHNHIEIGHIIQQPLPCEFTVAHVLDPVPGLGKNGQHHFAEHFIVLRTENPKGANQGTIHLTITLRALLFTSSFLLRVCAHTSN